MPVGKTRSLKLIFIREVSTRSTAHTFEPNRFDSAPAGFAWIASASNRGAGLESG